MASMQIILLFFISTGMNVHSSAVSSEPAWYSCNYGFTFYEGLFPTVIETMPEEEACQAFTECRPNAYRNATEPYRFNCADAGDPTMRFYDARTCKCVNTSDHCALNAKYQLNPQCYRDYVPGVSAESCRGFGEKEQHYLNHIPDLNDGRSYWQCAYNSTGNDHQRAVEAYPNHRQCPLPLVWSNKNCTCMHPDECDITEVDAFNQHPMNRFHCAVPINSTEADEVCKDERGRYWAGKFASSHGPHLYWECTQKGLELVAHGEEKWCPINTNFNVQTCTCDSGRPVQSSPLEASDRYACATLLEDCGEGSEPSCQDPDGNYYVGDIPHTLDCSKYYSCIWNPNEDGPSTIPIERSCQPSLLFNVQNENYCGCDYPQNTRCFQNGGESRFKCAHKVNETSWR